MALRHARLLAGTAVLTGIAWTAWGALGPRYGGELTVGVPLVTMPASLEPTASAGVVVRTLGSLVHETLVLTEAQGAPLPSLARSWSAGATGREWTLTLAPARFHDGSAVTAADAVRSLRRFLRSPSPAAARLAATLAGGSSFRDGTTLDLPGLAAPDPLHVVLGFSAPVAAPLAPLASPAAAITSASGAGAGPFVPGARSPRRLELTAFDGHVRGRPYLDRLSVLGLGEPAATLTELTAGRVQVVVGAETSAPPLAVLLLVLDPRHAPFDQPAARQAVSASVDSGGLVQHFISGGEPAAGLLPSSLLASIRSGPSATRASLGGTIVLAVSRDVPAPVSQRVVACLADLGLDVTVQPTEPELAALAPAAARLLWWSPEVAEAGLALRELAALVPELPEARAALDAADQEPGADRRRALLQRAESALRAPSTLTPLAGVPLPFRARAGVRGARADAAGAVALDDAWREP